MTTDAIRILVTLVPALVGALIYGIHRSRRGHSPLLGGLFGAIAGLAGGLVFMVPLNYCTFDPEHEPVDLYFGILLLVLGTFLALLIVDRALVFIEQRRSPDYEGDHRAGQFRGRWTPWLLLAPTLTILTLFLYYPAIDNFRLSLLLTRLGTSRTAFVCVNNYTLLLQPDYIRTIGITIFISLMIVILTLILALLVAYVAYQPIAGASIYRTLLIWPYAISPTVAGIIFSLVFNETVGIANRSLQAFGVGGVKWLTDANLAAWTIIFASVWKSMGFSILFYIAGLQNVPKDLVEAGAIDGANAVQRFRRIIVPMLSPITFYLVVTNITYAFFDTFGTIDFLTRGGPAGATSVMMYRIYVTGIQQSDLGKAAAQSIVLFVLVIGITLIQFRTQGNRAYGGNL